MQTPEQREEEADRFKDPNDPTKILIVVDMLLVGYDVPIVQVMYLDKGLREHTLLQAIARVNRIYDPGKTYGLIVEEYSIKFLDGEFTIEVKPSKQSPANTAMIKKLYEDWLIEKAQSVFKHRVEEYSKKLGVKVKTIVIKNLKNRWGSMTKEGSINLNVNLLKASEDVIDYIILHELCHLKIKEHSHHFWDLMYKFMSDYKDKRDWLNRNGNNLV